MKKFLKSSLQDRFVIIGLPILTTLVVELFHLPFIASVLMYYFLPPLYLFWRDPTIVKKVVLFSLIPWWPLTIIWEYLAYVDDIWFVPAAIRFLRDSLPYQDIFWGIGYLIYGIAVYEFFFNESKLKRLFPVTMKYLAVFLYGGLAIFLGFYFLAPESLYLPYFFVWMGVLFCVLPLVIYLFRHPAKLPTLLTIGIYFFAVFALMEHAALTQGHWIYPGTHYIGTVLFGGQRLPWDEIIFLWVFSVPALVCWYEYFGDDEK